MFNRTNNTKTVQMFHSYRNKRLIKPSNCLLIRKVEHHHFHFSAVPSGYTLKFHATIISFSLSLCFNGHFPGEPGLAGVYWSKGWWRWWWQLEYWSYKLCKAPVKSSPSTNQHPVFLQAGCFKALKGKYHIPWTCLPEAHLGVFQLCLWPLTSPGYFGGGLPCLSSALWCQYPMLRLSLELNVHDMNVIKANISLHKFLLLGVTQEADKTRRFTTAKIACQHLSHKSFQPGHGKWGIL